MSEWNETRPPSLLPRVTIGIPVHNGENYLEAAIESCLAQTFGDFELVISDNGSDDTTPEIIERYASRDRRIRALRSEVNRGATWNFNEVRRRARGEYFRWAAHDDTIEPEFLARCVDVLDRRPDVVLCHTGVRLMDCAGIAGPEFPQRRIPIGAPDAVTRFRALMLNAERCYEIFGLVRMSALERTPGLGDYGHADGVQLARLGLVGPFAIVEQPLQNMRIHDAQSMSVYGTYGGAGIDYRRWAEWYNPLLRSQRLLPHWRLLWEYTTSPLVVEGVPPTVGLRCARGIVRWTIMHRRRLAADLAHAGRSRLEAIRGRSSAGR